MPTDADLARYRDNLQGEIDASTTYRALADLEKQVELKELYNRLGAIEERHAAFWKEKLVEAGAGRIPTRPTLRARLTVWLARTAGASFVLPTLAATERTASHGYDAQPEVQGSSMAGEEQSHARVLNAVARSAKGADGGMLARLEGRHRAVGGNALRAAVLGANDGLVSTLSLVMGVAGGVATQPGGTQTVALAGLAGMLAGACAMAMGEWLSVQSARELAQRQLAIEEQELAEAPEEEMEELALIYQSKGLPAADARSLAEKLIADKATALDTLAREELGIDPEELGGSAWEAAIASFCLFVVGAVAPALPFLFADTMRTGIALSLGASAVALFLLGIFTHVLTGRGLWFSALRQLIIGMAAAGVTFGMGLLIGRLFGITVTA